MLQTEFSGVRPIQWIARFPIKKSDPSRPWPKEASPVRIARSALAPDVPQADLVITAPHAVLIDGLLIPAGNLVNGTTIRLEAREEDELEFFNIKMESHDAIYAEGTAVETMLGVNEGAVNFAEYFRMYGMPKTSGTLCALFVSYGGGRDELKSRIRSAVSPWVDCREQIDVIRDRLEERAAALAQSAHQSKCLRILPSLFRASSVPGLHRVEVGRGRAGDEGVRFEGCAGRDPNRHDVGKHAA